MGMDLWRFALCGSAAKGLRRASATEAMAPGGMAGSEGEMYKDSDGCGKAEEVRRRCGGRCDMDGWQGEGTGLFF